MDGWMDEMDGWMDGWMDGMDGWEEEVYMLYVCVYVCAPLEAGSWEGVDEVMVDKAGKRERWDAG